MQVIAKVSKWGNSLGLRINQKMADELHLGADSQVSLTVDEAEHVLIVSPIQERKVWPFNEAQLLEGMNSENVHGDLLAPLLESELL